MPGDANQRFPGWPQFWTELLVFGSGEMVPSGDSWMYPESQRTPMGNPYISPILTWVFMVYNPQNYHPRNSQLSLDARCLVSLICSIKLQWFATTLTYEEGWFGLWPVSSVNHTPGASECTMHCRTHWSTTSISQDLPQNIHFVRGFPFQWDSTKMFFVELVGCMNDTSKQMDTYLYSLIIVLNIHDIIYSNSYITNYTENII